ncbi:outer membrane protein assembly factor BamE [Sulfitobacter sabulilitoris]|uniref:Outer membrane protein assembly factor BamE n=1 Tax=Sulfitobacter sabulilitoris TaxID=2562655 RepID=A0A5S3PKE8_9RHOB|nr:outer membrane protein assembly factor BamE [Sulfitobacter sabulilitoris]TMM54827.1 outer membrane protein assembly factor BamE [Sulfitobacter sabulilitoris]
MRITINVRSAARFGLVAAVLLGLGACSPSYRTHGYVPPRDDLDQLALGVDTRASVEDALGPPASGGLLDDSSYYYVRSRVRQFAILEPKVVEREVVAISFDAAGVVQNVESFGLEQGRVVPLARRVTSSGVTDKTFVRQLLGNIGRFSPAGLGG